MGNVGAGRKPLADRSNVRNRVPIKDWHEVPDAPYLDGNARRLPFIQGGWPKATYDWWRTLRTMPHAVLWTEADWQFAATTALVHSLIWGPAQELGKCSELRQRERILGVTEESRRDLRIRYVPVEETPAELAEVTTLTSVRSPRIRAIDPDA
jgi:hypothetical protein